MKPSWDGFPDEPTRAMCRAGIEAYEELMGGDRLPDGEGYDSEVVAGIFKAMLAAAQKETRP